MEIKKSDKASLEARRPLWFLIAMVVVLATFYVGIDYTSHPPEAGDDVQLDDMVQDIDLVPAIDRSNMIAAAPEKAKAQKVNVVDEVKQEMEKQNTLTQLRDASAHGEGTDGGAKAENDESATATQAQPPVAVDADDNPLKLRVVEQLPEFPGGMVAMMKWITKTLRYPVMAQKQKIEGKVVVTFIINRDGTIAQVKIARGADPLLNAEALRVVRMMPQWKPGLQDGKPCRTMFAIPIEFRL